jgi:hypothetical protein
MYVNIILPSTPRSSKLPLSLRFAQTLRQHPILKQAQFLFPYTILVYGNRNHIKIDYDNNYDNVDGDSGDDDDNRSMSFVSCNKHRLC